MEAIIPKDMEDRLNHLQQKLLVKGIPVLILFEGGSGRAIGRVINELMRCLEPRGVSYHHFDPHEIDSSMSLMSFLWNTPGNGRIGLYDRAWYSLIIERYGENKSEKELDRMLDSCNSYEKYLSDNGVFLVKILLKASESDIKRYGPQYGPEDGKRSFLSMDHIDPVKYGEVMLEKVHKKTDTRYCPWDIVKVSDIHETVMSTAEKISERLEYRVRNEPVFVSSEMELKYQNPRKGLELEKECDSYSEKLAAVSKELGELQLKLSESGRSLIIGFEGWDAAGKGTVIKHLCHALNPRGYTVSPTKVPTQEESEHTYLWRFCRDVPYKGHITIYDRTWYGRMMVEPIEGFCTDNAYKRSPHEINMFESLLERSGAIVIKFWMEITPDEQLCRFNKRKEDPLKRWKITDDDWRNRSKWDEYEAKVDTMMETTNTEKVPWIVVESNNKKYARVKVLKTIVETLKRELDD